MSGTLNRTRSRGRPSLPSLGEGQGFECVFPLCRHRQGAGPLATHMRQNHMEGCAQMTQAQWTSVRCVLCSTCSLPYDTAQITSHSRNCRGSTRRVLSQAIVSQMPSARASRVRPSPAHSAPEPPRVSQHQIRATARRVVQAPQERPCPVRECSYRGRTEHLIAHIHTQHQQNTTRISLSQFEAIGCTACPTCTLPYTYECIQHHIDAGNCVAPHMPAITETLDERTGQVVAMTPASNPNPTTSGRASALTDDITPNVAMIAHAALETAELSTCHAPGLSQCIHSNPDSGPSRAAPAPAPIPAGRPQVIERPAENTNTAEGGQ